MSTELAIPSKTIVPKPTKNEIISAMVEIAREKFAEEREALIKARDDIQVKINKRYEKAFKARLKSLKLECVSFTFSHKPEIYIGSLYLDNDEESARLHRELNTAYSAANISFDEARTKARLRSQFFNIGHHADRVQLLLNDPESKAYLTEMMKSAAA